MIHARIRTACLSVVVFLAPTISGAQGPTRAQQSEPQAVGKLPFLNTRKIEADGAHKLPSYTQPTSKSAQQLQDEILRELIEQGWKPSTTSGAFVHPNLADLLMGTNRRPPEWTQMPSSPSIAAGVLEEEARKKAEECRRDPSACSEASRVQAALTSLNVAVRANRTCSTAASNYLTTYSSSEGTKKVMAIYDMACLGSFEPRQRTVGFAPDIPPGIFTSTAGSGPSAMTAIGLLEANRKPVCAGLLRNDGTFVTARHCFDGAASTAWKAGTLRVRPVDGRNEPWAISDSFYAAGAASSTVKDDWAVVRLITSGAIGAAPTELALDTPSGDVTLLGYFEDHTAASYGPDASSEDWRRGLRWPRTGLCQVYRQVGDCLQLMCQTVRGFSGTPIFSAAAPGPGKPLLVLGFVSRPHVSETAACGAPQTYVTLAAAARVARPLP